MYRFWIMSDGNFGGKYYWFKTWKVYWAYRILMREQIMSRPSQSILKVGEMPIAGRIFIGGAVRDFTQTGLKAMEGKKVVYTSD